MRFVRQFNLTDQDRKTVDTLKEDNVLQEDNINVYAS